MSLSRFVRCALASATVCSAATMAPMASAANDVFLQLDGIPGEAVDDPFRDQIVVNTFTLGVSAGGASGAGAGASPAPGRPQFDTLTVTKRIDKSSPRLFLAAATSEAIKKATLSTRKQGAGKQGAFYRVTLTDVLVTSVKVSEGTELLETVSFTFGKVEIEYMMTNEKGQVVPAGRVGYDLRANRKV